MQGLLDAVGRETFAVDVREQATRALTLGTDSDVESADR
jgi:hypothetical protein